MHLTSFDKVGWETYQFSEPMGSVKGNPASVKFGKVLIRPICLVKGKQLHALQPTSRVLVDCLTF